MASGATGVRVPEVLNDFNYYDEDSNQLAGIVSVELPEIAVMTQTVSGAGMAGEIEAPVLGQVQSMETTINRTLPDEDAIRIAAGAPVACEVRGAAQCWDSGSNSYKIKAIRCVIRGRAKTFTPGAFQMGSQADTSSVIETTYLKVEIDGEVQIEIDKFAYICRIGGRDLLAEVRAALGV